MPLTFNVHETFTFPDAGDEFPHGAIWLKRPGDALGRAYITNQNLNNNANPWVIRLDTPRTDLTAYTQTYFTTTGFPRRIDQIRYSAAVDRLFAHQNQSGRVRVDRIHPDTNAITASFIDDTASPINTSFSFADTLVCVGDHVYVVVGSLIGGDTILAKYLASDGSRVATLTLTGLTNAHSIETDGTHLYVMRGGGAVAQWVAKVPLDLSGFVSSTFDSDQHIATDDFAISVAHGLGCTGFESGGGIGTLALFETADITQYTRIETGISASIYGVYFAHGFFWVVFNGTPGVIGRLHPTTLNWQTVTLPSGLNVPNELIFDELGNIWGLTYTSPMKVFRATSDIQTHRLASTQAAGNWTPEAAGTLHENLSDDVEATVDRLLTANAPSMMRLRSETWQKPGSGNGKLVVRVRRNN